MNSITLALLRAEELITHHIGDTPETRLTLEAIKEAQREVHWQTEAKDLLAAAMDDARDQARDYREIHGGKDRWREEHA